MKVVPNPNQHVSASASHYDQEAKHYDAFNEIKSAQTNQIVEKFLQNYDVKTVLDLSCGTGLQVFWLAKLGYEVVGVDINHKMLEIAKNKAEKQNLSVPLEQGDMRSYQGGKFDAVITIHSAIGHLTQEDFELAIQNIRNNLNANGLYIFDIFNFDYLSHEDNITKLTIDWQKRNGDTIAREIQYSTISQSGVLASYDIYHEQVDLSSPKITTAFQTLQVYSATQLQEILVRNGFEVMQQVGMDGTSFNPKETERILTVARRC